MDFLSEVGRYNQNWNAVRKRLKNRKIEPDRDDLFVCPICFRCFSQEYWNRDYLSVEHVPPKSLGGKPLTITCKRCNNLAGTALDANLIKEQKFIEFVSGVPNATFEGKYFLEGMSSKVVAEMSFPEDSTWQILGIPHRTNPLDIRRIYDLGSLTKMQIFFDIGRRHRFKIARLRIAYLWAFSMFGYGILLNYSYFTIRDQILNPDQKILDFHLEPRSDFPEQFIGVNLVNSPKELQGIFICFSLRRPQGSFGKYSVLLPKPTLQGLENLRYLTTSENHEVNMTHIFDEIDITTYPFPLHDYWDEDVSL